MKRSPLAEAATFAAGIAIAMTLVLGMVPAARAPGDLWCLRGDDACEEAAHTAARCAALVVRNGPGRDECKVVQTPNRVTELASSLWMDVSLWVRSR